MERCTLCTVTTSIVQQEVMAQSTVAYYTQQWKHIQIKYYTVIINTVFPSWR